MPAAIRPKQEVIERLAEAFRHWGYDSATLARLSEETGLVKASLYHYFPNGKRDMGAAVLQHLGERFMGEVLAPFLAEADPRRAFEILAEKLFAFYIQGRVSCLLELFTLGTARPLFAETVKARLLRLRDALALKAREAGVSADQARKRANRVLALIQGSLVIARGLGEPDAFQQQMDTLAATMLDPQAE